MPLPSGCDHTYNQSALKRRLSTRRGFAKQLYLIQLMWTVMSAMASFRHREGWRGQGFEKLVWAEALTAAVLPRVYLLNDMKRYVKGNPNMKRDLLTTIPDDDEVA
jgi:hypothetical protein